MALDSRQDMFTRRRMPMLRLQMGEQRVREVVGVVTRERLLAARAAQSESVHDTPVSSLYDPWTEDALICRDACGAGAGYPRRDRRGGNRARVRGHLASTTTRFLAEGGSQGSVEGYCGGNLHRGECRLKLGKRAHGL